MTKSELFKRAHIIARMTKEAAGSYQIAFKCALKAMYTGIYCKFETMLKDLRDVFEAARIRYGLTENVNL